MAKERFRDWGLYHKAVAAVAVAAILSVVVRALLMIDAAFELRAQVTLDVSAAEIWPWIIGNLRRSDWQGEITKVQGLSTDVGRSRLLYWKRGYDEWSSYEKTTALVPERLFKVAQDSDFDNRWWQVELVPLSPCKTRVKLVEIIQPLEYRDRFWFFQVREERQARLENSVKALKRWIGETAKPCSAADTAGQ
jgi:hypothetical protein